MLSKRPSTFDRSESKSNGAASPWSTLRDLLLQVEEKSGQVSQLLDNGDCHWTLRTRTDLAAAFCDGRILFGEQTLNS